MRAVASSELCSVVNPLRQKPVAEAGRSRPCLTRGKALGDRGRIGDVHPNPPPGVGEMARVEGSLTQSREGLGVSPDQVVGQRPAV